MDSLLGVLRFDEKYFERVWGGHRLSTVFGKKAPTGAPIGEAWLVSDHPNHTSTVIDGPATGRSLRSLMEEDPKFLLGSRPQATPDGRFPLLLKLLDASDYLSVQVHPDDAAARLLGEPDVGKTESWYVLEAEPEAELICGMPPQVTKDAFAAAVGRGTVADLLTRFPVHAGTAVFVPAGTVHAIGPGILLAEIQQNSDITYRVYDWDRPGQDGRPRELHVDKSLAVTHFGSRHGGAQEPLSYMDGHAVRRVLCGCPYFAAEEVRLDGPWLRRPEGSFQLVLACSGALLVEDGKGRHDLLPGQACLVPGGCPEFVVRGKGVFLLYYVPELLRDIVGPLRGGGHGEGAIERLVSGGSKGFRSIPERPMPD